MLGGSACSSDGGASGGLDPVQPGALAVAVTGLPSGAVAAVTVTGPAGFSRSLSGAGTLTGLEPGSYVVAAEPVVHGGDGYASIPAAQSVTVAAGPIVTSAAVVYQLTTGRLAVDVTGVPDGAAALVRVTGPEGYEQELTGTGVLVGLAPGEYAVSAAPILASDGHRYEAGAEPGTVAVTATATPATVNVPYAIATGALDVTISGLPGGVTPGVTVSGPGVTESLVGSAMLVGLDPGSYTVDAGDVAAGDQIFRASPTSETVIVAIGGTTTIEVEYAVATGSLDLSVVGLPAGAPASITVTGPAGFTAAPPASQVLAGLWPGGYTIAAAPVVVAGTTWTPAPQGQQKTVAAGATVSATVTYASPAPPPPPPPPVSFNLVIDGMYLTQAAQRYDGTTPLVSGRDGYLRVFVSANEPNAAAPPVRVRFYAGATLVQTSTIPAPATGVPTSVSETPLGASWNLPVPAALVQPGLSILADVDPAGAVPEASETDNVFPANGAPGAVDVRALPAFSVRFVPVLQQANGLEGAVHAGNVAQFLGDVSQLLPIADIDADVRATYTTSAPVLESNNGNGAWGTILSEVLSLRLADGSNRYYYGVVKTTYGSGVAGMGYLGGGARTAIGWDRLPSGSGVMAHEVGHNMGRPHAPCGGAGGADANYPYPGGQIGVWGLDVQSLTLKAPTATFDLMGYCNPDWVSDYTWTAMIQYRQSNPSYAPPAVPLGGGLLVRARISREGAVLDPAFRVDAPPANVGAAGRYRVEGLAADGTRLFSWGVSPIEAVDDRNAAEQHLVAVLPVPPADEAALATLRLVTPAGTVERRRTAAAASRLFMPDPGALLTRLGPSAVQLAWDAGAYPMAMIRDAATNEIVAFARGGRATVAAGVRTLAVTFSDGVQSVRATLRP